mmetsp:Transcript_60658/g.112518  ORF Transcript_60658/g.112518 Transcript_60658/m.112518 type:complete len:331 (+) Transcript_60658:79-1071(+)
MSSVMMAKLVALWCVLVGSVQAIRGTEELQPSLVDARAPGCACKVSSCCQQLSSANSLWDDVVSAKSKRTFAFSNWQSGDSPQCALLGLSPNTSELCEADGKADEALDVCTALEQDLPELDFPLLGVVTEPGSCAELSAGTCPPALGKGRATLASAVWSKDLYYDNTKAPDSRSPCKIHSVISSSHSETSSESGAIRYAATCDQDGNGLRLRAQWNMASLSATSDNSPCKLDDQVDIDKLVTDSNWTLPPSPGLPRWTCVDVPGGGGGYDVMPKYRMLAYSLGSKLPCQPKPPSVPRSKTPNKSLKSDSRHSAVMSGIIAIGILAGNRLF